MAAGRQSTSEGHKVLGLRGLGFEVFGVQVFRISFSLVCGFRFLLWALVSGVVGLGASRCNVRVLLSGPRTAPAHSYGQACELGDVSPKPLTLNPKGWCTRWEDCVRYEA